MSVSRSHSSRASITITRVSGLRISARAYRISFSNCSRKALLGRSGSLSIAVRICRAIRGYLRSKLGGEGGKQPGGVSPVGLASLEEEARAEEAAFVEALCNSTGHGRFPRTGHTVQPKYSLSIGILCPACDLAEKVDTCLGMAACVVLVRARVECRSFALLAVGGSLVA